MFYDFNQNNPRGILIDDDKVTSTVIIEADNFDEANKRFFYDLQLEYGPECSCCGSRWTEKWEENGTAVPTIWGQPVNVVDEVNVHHEKSCYIYYKDGTKKEGVSND
jgi:hypothetical protein